MDPGFGWLAAGSEGRHHSVTDGVPVDGWWEKDRDLTPDAARGRRLICGGRWWCDPAAEEGDYQPLSWDGDGKLPF